MQQPETGKPMSANRLPNFLIIGAARSATSSLYFYLKEHPEIFMCPDKEAQFFGFFGTQRAHKSKYPTLESYMALYDGVRDETIIGEATPTYLALPESAQAIHHYCPGAKLLASLRNPVDRAFSYYEMSRSKGHEKAHTFEEWVDGNTFWMRSGGYADHLDRFLALFKNKQLKVILFEDIQDRLEDTLVDIHRFLGVTEIRPQVRPMAYNMGGRPKGIGGALLYRMTTMSNINRVLKPFVPANIVAAVHRARNQAVAPGNMKQETRQRLIEHYREDILRTQDAIKRDLSHWLVIND
jgi:hypothetical protein